MPEEPKCWPLREVGADKHVKPLLKPFSYLSLSSSFSHFDAYFTSLALWFTIKIIYVNVLIFTLP